MQQDETRGERQLCQVRGHCAEEETLPQVEHWVQHGRPLEAVLRKVGDKYETTAFEHTLIECKAFLTVNR